MHLDIAGALRSEFRGRADSAAYQRFQQQQREEQLRRDRKESLDEDATEAFELAMAVISASDVRDFKLDLDRYDTATVAALQQNETELALSRERLDALLANAHVLPDGRRVFKTEDGLRVFDEDGIELTADTIEPQDIADERTRWEIFKGEKDRFNELEQERRELIDYQDKLDAARERLDDGDMTRKEFDELRDGLKTDMPDAIRNQVPELADQQISKPAAGVAESAIDLEISDDMTPTGSALKLSAPALKG